MPVNLTDGTPAAPTNKTNVKWQTDGTDVSAYIDQWASVTKTHADSPYTAVAYQHVMVDTSGGAVAVTLPSSAGNKPVKISKITSDANLVTVTPASGNINNLANLSIAAIGDTICTMPDGTNWWLF